MTEKKRRRHTALRDDLACHPAVRAWAAATSLDSTPEYLHVLRERTNCAIYRLPGLGAEGTAVIAKRSLARWVRIESTVYESILPRLPLMTPRYYGSTIDEPFGWIFVEDAGDEEYSISQPEHLALAAQWVGTLHTRAAGIAAAQSLPDAGPARYLAHLRTGRREILRITRLWAFPPSERKALLRAAGVCEAVEARWSRVEAACHGAPSTLVHGDFRPKNAFLRQTDAGLTLCPIDWETAGFGLPAADLARIDLDTYWCVVRRAWPDVTLDSVQRLAKIGQLLGWVAAMEWGTASAQLSNASVRSAAIGRLDLLVDRLAESGRAAGVLD